MRALRLAVLAPTFAALSAVPAHAEPVSLFVTGIIAGFTSGGLVLGGAATAFSVGFGIGAFLATPIGGLLLTVGLNLAGAFLTNLFSGQQQTTPPDAAKINVRIEAANRWLHAGLARAGGAAIFGEFDSSGAFWYVTAIGDSELLSTTALMFDDVTLNVDSNRYVINDDFLLTTTGTRPGGFLGLFPEEYETIEPVFQIWTATFTPANPVPAGIPAGFYSAFAAWTSAHKMAGVTLAIVRAAGVRAEDRYKVYRWRGPFGLGEPAVSIVGQFSRVYDPRNGSHNIANPATWGPSRNSALIWAWFRTHAFGYAAPMDAINWTMTADAADKCDVSIVDKYGDAAPRYRCGISVPDNKQRSAAEAEILATCDGVLMFDADGKAYPDVGVWREPALGLSKARDIMAMSSREAQDGESETDGVVVYYTEPAFGYIRQPCAAWVNPDYYEIGTSPNYLTIDILGCQNHRQAVTLAKAIGLRSQARQRLAPTVGLRGLLARRERVISLDYDESFTGNYEIVAPVELDEGGFASSLALVPVDQYRWTLLEGEEGDKPAANVSAGGTNTYPYPTNLSIYAAIVPGSSGNSVRLEATFDPSPRADNRYEFQYRKVGETSWRDFFVNMRQLLAVTDVVEDGQTYQVRYRTVSSSGGGRDYIDPIPELVATADPVPPAAVTAVVGTGGVGEATIEWVSPNSANYVGARIWRHTIDNFGAATLVRTEYGPANTYDQWVDSGQAADDYYYWVEAINGSGVPAAEEPTGLVVVT